MQGVITMSHKRVLACFIAGLSLLITGKVTAKDDNQQQLEPTPAAASKNFQPALAQSLNKMLAQHLCRASKQLTVRCIYHDHYNVPDTEVELGLSEAEIIIPD